MADVKVTKMDLEDLHYWLITKGIDPYNMEENFANGTLMACLLKMIHPKLIELRRYEQHSDIRRKINNWALLNMKALAKLNLLQSMETLEEIASGKTGAVKKLLVQVMKTDKVWQNAK